MEAVSGPRASVPPGSRLNFLDWMRTVLVVLIVYAHSIFCGANIGRPFRWSNIDDHAFNLKDPNQLSTRWVSVVRQWCIPLLFWISGTACAMSFGSSARFLKGLAKLAVITAVGVAGNAAMWLLGPQDETCAFRTPCRGKGILFDFTEDPYDGNIGPYSNQMWYTFALMIAMVLNWPLMNSMSNNGLGWYRVVVQWAVLSALYYALVLLADVTPRPSALVVQLSVCEFAFLSVALGSASLARRIPLRLVHYVCGLIAVLQMGPITIVDGDMPGGMALSYILYLIVGVNRWFGLGFVMTLPRSPKSTLEDVRPLGSLVWPITLIAMLFCAPTTNWVMGGMLPYPYMPCKLDRTLYVGGTTCFFFVIDRCSRSFECKRMPGIFANASIVLYVMQPVLLTVFLQIFEPWVRSEIKPLNRNDGVVSMCVILALCVLSSIGLAILMNAVSLCFCKPSSRHVADNTMISMPMSGPFLETADMDRARVS
eukprot:TRINITY_DN27127_c0_g1_i1.p1 TRINITY_DN27127_c0_g1~~TRINITY_DN27127_c0_g1_i1.p1  ORF type:complete len:495 (-),score=35.13 TRINITY_DN27127_c0_g1_i1:48-1493(-)